ncbi:MAG: serine/threonine protein kinase [Verrucomicrobia bacterium]|nr:MAG: serine/threonine protein kinase [Verrucomicrobiota bacterium]
MLSFLRRQKDAEGHLSPGPFGRFTLHELINSGGMADIWLATDEANRTLALRCLHTDNRFDLTARKRFLRGCKILSQVHHHEFVIGYIEHGRIRGVPYLAMEYVEGANLKLLMGTSDPILEQYAGNILIDAATGLEHIHESGFMHLDFKPENIMVTRSGNVRLVDFDLALPRPEFAKKLASYPGTAAYMAPELLQRAEVDHRADIFAFGVTAYELVTFQKPFPGENAAQVLQAQLERQGFVNPRALNEAVPVALERIILKCLETDPNRRYPFTSVLVRDLQRALYV